MRSVALLLASLAIIGIAAGHFGYGTVARSPAVAPSAAQTQAERALTVLDVWAQSVIPSMLLEHSQARALAARDPRLAARLGRRLRTALIRVESFDADLERDAELRTGDSIDARSLRDAADAWRAWAAALRRLPVKRSQRSATLLDALETRAVRLHQAAYAVVDASLRAAVTGR